MNFSILIFLCVVVFQIADHQCNAALYETCKGADKVNCLGSSRSLACDHRNCKRVCWPDFKSCCDCDFQKKKKCFSSASEVNLENGKSVTISELQLGDRVQTGNEIFN